MRMISGPPCPDNPRLEIQNSFRGAAKVTVVVVTSDIRRPFSQKALSLLKKHTPDMELIVLDNCRRQDFSHPVEMRRILKSIETDFVVLMDDDVFVPPLWLESLLKCIDEKTAVVTPVHRDRHGSVSYSGAYITNETRFAEHLIDLPLDTREIQTYCSALVMLDLRKIRDIEMDLSYRKYFFDNAHGLKVWEAGYKVLCTPLVIVTHLGGATQKRFSPSIEPLYKADRETFLGDWIASGRLSGLERGIWKEYPSFEAQKEIALRTIDFFDAIEEKNDEELEKGLDHLMAITCDYNMLRNLLVENLTHYREKLTNADKETSRRQKILGKEIERLISIIPEKGGASFSKTERFLVKILTGILGAEKYLRVRRELGSFLRSHS